MQMEANKQLPTHIIARALLAGLAATLALTLMMYKGAPMITGKAMDIAGELSAMMAVPWAMGMAVHFMLGVLIFPAVYVLVVQSRLPGSAIFRGILWGLLLWAIAMLIMSPMMGKGLFMGAAPAAIASFMGHAVYGGLLSVVIGSVTSTSAVKNQIRPHD
jgi:uncharacterized membrane protein YagU involved in acid resistance